MSTIPEDTYDSVHCRLCGMSFKRIRDFHFKKHHPDISFFWYKTQYPVLSKKVLDIFSLNLKKKKKSINLSDAKDTDDTIYCRVCGKSFSFLTKRHFIKYHPDINFDDYKKQYPTTSKKKAEQFIQFNKTWRNPEGKTEEELLIMKERMEKRNLTHKQTLKGIPFEVKLKRESQRRINYKKTQSMKTEEQRLKDNQKVSEGIKEYISSLTGKDKSNFLDKCKKNSKIPAKNYTLYLDNQSIEVIGQIEKRFGEFLIESKILFDYESLKIPYIYQDKQKTYFPDFYIPAYNLVIECKPSTQVYDLKVQTKKNATIRMGYNFEFITQKDIKNLSLWKAKYLDDKYKPISSQAESTLSEGSENTGGVQTP